MANLQRLLKSVNIRGVAAAQHVRHRFASTTSQATLPEEIELESPKVEPNKPGFELPNDLSLSLSGGNDGEEERVQQMQRIQKELKRLKFPEFAKISIKDVVWVNDSTTLVGTGSETNITGVRHALTCDVFKTSKVFTVRDVFERSPERPTLKDCFKLVSNDVTAILSDIQIGPRRRLCNEYYRPSGVGSTYTLQRHDMDFIECLHEHGYRIVPVESREKLDALNFGDVPRQQSTNHVMMVAPTAFEVNADAAMDNHFMSNDPFSNSSRLQKKVIEEFEALHSKLTAKKTGAGLCVHLFTHEAYHDTPDAVFPNNWFSTHTDLEVGECTLCLYPMKAPSRRKERRPDFLERLHSFSRYTNLIDMTRQEQSASPRFLEGTGSLVLDRINRVAYAAISDRTDISLSRMWARVMGYTLVPFRSTDEQDRPIYHTNVMMSVGTSVAVVALESIPNAKERGMLVDTLRSTGHEVVDISLKQVDAFCGNVLEVENYYGKPVLAMSTQAYDAFTPAQRETLLAHEDELIHADISTLERVGGGGVRCSIGELF